MNFFFHRYKKLGHTLDPKFKPQQSIRINTLKAPKNILQRLKDKEVILKKISFLKNGFYIDSDFSMGSTTEYLMGYYYIQKAASQAVAEILDPKKEELVLDMCAAPGSKTTHLSELMKNEGNIIALDSNFNRVQALNNNLERMGCKNVTVYRKDAKYADELGLEFDKILLDAPCSGNYTLEEDWFEIRKMDDFEDMKREQKKLIAAAIDLLKPGGVLIYSTCSLEPEENEQVIEYALDNFDVKLQPIKMTFGQQGTTTKTILCKRFWPDTEKTQGFFIAKLEKIS